MSHFSVLVISPTELTTETLGAILQPWHEFECTGKDDQYVQNVDITEEALSSYHSDVSDMLRSPEGELVSTYNNRFYRDPTPEEQEKITADGPFGRVEGLTVTTQDWDDGLGYRPKIKFIPEGWTEVEVPTSEIKSAVDFISDYYGKVPVGPDDKVDLSGKHKYGYVLVDGDGNLVKVIDRTNPNKKWDWWQVGGRYSGRFAVNYDPSEDPANKESCWLCHGTGKREDMEVIAGCNGCGGTGVAIKWPTRWRTIGNIAQLKDIPLHALRDEAEIQALKDYDKATEVIAGRQIPSWEQIRTESDNIDLAREKFNNDPVIKDLRAADILSFWDIDEQLKTLRTPRHEVAAAARRRALQTYAVVKDDQWYERGEMGWFGMASNEKDRDQWDVEYAKLLDGLPEDTWLAVVDCHI